MKGTDRAPGLEMQQWAALPLPPSLTKSGASTRPFPSVSERVDRLAETVYGGPPAAKRTKRTESSSSLRASGHTSRHWADRKDSGLEAPLPRFHDESCDEAADSDGESGSPSSAAKQSADSQTLICNSFASSISNAERRKIRAKYPHSGLQRTRCSKLDPIFNTVSGKAGQRPTIQSLPDCRPLFWIQWGPFFSC